MSFCLVPPEGFDPLPFFNVLRPFRVPKLGIRPKPDGWSPIPGEFSAIATPFAKCPSASADEMPFEGCRRGLELGVWLELEGER